MSPSSVRSGTQASAVASSTHSPAGLFTPVLSTGERGSGLAVPGRPSVSMRSTFPASEPRQRAVFARVSGRDEEQPVGVHAQRTRVVRRAARDPDEHRLRRLARGEPHHPVVRRRGDVGVDEPVLRVRRRQHEPGEPAAAARVHRIVVTTTGPPVPHPQHAAGRALADQRRQAVGQRRDRADRRQARRHDLRIRVGAARRSTRGAALGRVRWRWRLLGGGRAAAGGPPSSPTPSILSRQSRGPPSGNDAQPPSNRTASSAITPRPGHPPHPKAKHPAVSGR